jgi:hypothetical protein
MMALFHVLSNSYSSNQHTIQSFSLCKRYLLCSCHRMAFIYTTAYNAMTKINFWESWSNQQWAQCNTEAIPFTRHLTDMQNVTSACRLPSASRNDHTILCENRTLLGNFIAATRVRHYQFLISSDIKHSMHTVLPYESLNLLDCHVHL